MGRVLLVLIVGAAIAVGAAALLTSPAQANPGAGLPTGTFLVDFAVGPLTLRGIGTLHTDGTWTMSDQTDAGGVPGLASVQSEWHGVWEITGPNQTTITGVCFNFGPGGVPTGAVRLTARVEWAPGFKSATGLASQRFYTLAEDPLDPNAGTLAPPPLDALPISVRKMVD